MNFLKKLFRVKEDSPSQRLEAIQEDILNSYSGEVGESQFMKQRMTSTYNFEKDSRRSIDDLLNMGETARQRLRARRTCAFWFARLKLIYAAACLRELRNGCSEQHSSNNHDKILREAFNKVLSGEWPQPRDAT